MANPKPVYLVRPPFGDPFFSGDETRNRKVADAIVRQGSLVVMWHIDPRDYDLRDAPAIARAARKQLAERRQGVVLLHDGASPIKPTLPIWTPDVLRELLPWLASEGLRLVTISELVESKYGMSPAEVVRASNARR